MQLLKLLLYATCSDNANNLCALHTSEIARLQKVQHQRVFCLNYADLHAPTKEFVIHLRIDTSHIYVIYAV